MAKENRGFASMDRNKQREIASKGGKAAHQKGTAHEWTKDEAREAGRKGGMMSNLYRRLVRVEPETPSSEDEGVYNWQRGIKWKFIYILSERINFKRCHGT